MAQIGYWPDIDVFFPVYQTKLRFNSYFDKKALDGRKAYNQSRYLKITQKQLYKLEIRVEGYVWMTIFM